MYLHGLCRLGRDAELRYLTDGTPVLGMALAYNYGKKDEKGNCPTQWIDASLFGDRAKALQPYLVKGQQINALIEDVRVEQFTKRDNTVGNALRGRVVSLEFAGAASDKKATGSTSTPNPAGAAGAQKPATTSQTTSDFGDFSDDIPF
jgi:single-strand DNA-binding protein